MFNHLPLTLLTSKIGLLIFHLYLFAGGAGGKGDSTGIFCRYVAYNKAIEHLDIPRNQKLFKMIVNMIADLFQCNVISCKCKCNVM